MFIQMDPKERLGYATLAALLLAIFGVLGWRASQHGAAPDIQHLRAARSAAPQGSGEEQIMVHVAGAVTRPGVYRLPLNSRIQDAVRAAGGGNARADLDAINLASKLADGQQILLPTKDLGSPNPPPSDRKGGKIAVGTVSLNSATVQQLQQLPGVGPATAEKIVDFRKQHGGFSNIEQLKEVGGIGDKKLSRIRPHLTL